MKIIETYQLQVNWPTCIYLLSKLIKNTKYWPVSREYCVTHNNT